MVLDTETGRTASKGGLTAFEWEDNNWSCDCNRAGLFMDDREYWRWTDHCKSDRFVVVESYPSGDIERMNEGYPDNARQMALEWRSAHG